MNLRNLRVIKTARSVTAINDAIKEGFQVLVKPVVPSSDIKSKYAVFRDRATGLIEVVNDYRAIPGSHFQELSTHEVLIPFTYYYPYHFESPFAAYLIPLDITVGEEVWIEDLIEDVVGSTWNQGDTYRMQSSEGRWSGDDLVIAFEPKQGCVEVVG